MAISATLFHTTRDYEILQKLHDEIRNKFPTPQSIQVGPKLDACIYLRACVDEAMRISPPTPGIFWCQAEKDLCIDGDTIPADTGMGTGVYALHHEETSFPEPNRYRPQRFLDTRSKEAFIPFLRGFRSCPAQKLVYPMVLLKPIARLM